MKDQKIRTTSLTPCVHVFCLEPMMDVSLQHNKIVSKSWAIAEHATENGICYLPAQMLNQAARHCRYIIYNYQRFPVRLRFGG